MKAKLRDECVGLGGTPSKPMPSNLFLNIILGISALAILCKVGGILPLSAGGTRRGGRLSGNDIHTCSGIRT